MEKKIIRSFTFIFAIVFGIISAKFLCLPNALTLNAEQTIPQDGLVAYWNLDEGSGNTASEITKNKAGRDLTVKGTTKWVDGKYGKAFYFDGNTVLEMDGAKAIKTYNLTVAFWAKIDDFPASDTGANLFVVNSDLAAIDKGAFDFGFFGKGLYGYVVNNFGGGTGDRVSHGKDISDQITGKWQHFAVVFDTDEEKEFAKIYLNGSEVVSSKLTSILGLQIKLGYAKTAAYKKCALNFGGYSDTAGVVQRAIKGAMDDIVIYDRALGIDEIEQLAGIAAVQSSEPSSSSKSSSKVISSVTISSSIFEESSTLDESEELSEAPSIDSSTPETSILSSLVSSSQSISEDDEEEKSNTLTIVIILIIVVALFGGIGWLIFTRKKK